MARDLGVSLDEKLSFSFHMDLVSSRAMRALGYLKRHTRDFSNIQALVLLYEALVLPILEYASVVWAPHYSCHIAQLERVQHKFLRYVAFKLHIPSCRVDYRSCW
uniref:RNA-directed DNA polymerase from mobile element jockey n=1 Tax=Lygus hesperus TaxID=30085 RepID=A0A0A9YEP3_LYGHE